MAICASSCCTILCLRSTIFTVDCCVWAFSNVRFFCFFLRSVPVCVSCIVGARADAELSPEIVSFLSLVSSVAFLSTRFDRLTIYAFTLVFLVYVANLLLTSCSVAAATLLFFKNTDDELSFKTFSVHFYNVIFLISFQLLH